MEVEGRAGVSSSCFFFVLFFFVFVFVYFVFRFVVLTTQPPVIFKIVVFLFVS